MVSGLLRKLLNSLVMQTGFEILPSDLEHIEEIFLKNWH
jgi:hypothetical protein